MTPTGWSGSAWPGWPLGCIVIGVLPQLALRAAGSGHRQCSWAQTIAPGPSVWWIAPIAPEQASYSGLIFLAGIARRRRRSRFVLVRLLAHGRMRRTAAWDCGYPWQTSRMQDTAEGFGQPIRHMFGAFFRMERDLPSPADQRAALPHPHRRPLLARALSSPSRARVQRLADAVSVLQGGRLAIYLLYSFLTLLGLLVFVL